MFLDTLHQRVSIGVPAFISAVTNCFPVFVCRATGSRNNAPEARMSISQIPHVGAH
jgi:hypothetical protein